MELVLQPEEARLLRRVLVNYLSDLRMEISGTEVHDLRQALHRDEDTVKVLIDHLGKVAVASS